MRWRGAARYPAGVPGDVALHYDLVGRGPVVVLLHAWTAHRGFWSRQVPRSIPLADADETARRTPGARLVVLADSGHAPLREQPNR